MHDIMKNPLVSKEDLQDFTKQMLQNVVKTLSPQSAWLNAGETGTKYAHKIAWTEGFLRPLFGLVPLSAGSATGENVDIWNVYMKGIVNGTNPESKEYWGEIQGKDQRLVEMTTLGLALAIVPEKVWDPLCEQEKKHLTNWLLQINQIELPTNNWLFFYVMVNMGLKKVGTDYDAVIMEAALDKIEECYLDGGWYADGLALQRDYYVPFAMHYYGLIYAKLMEEDDPERAVRYKSRAADFAKDFIYWFGKEGDALPYGRSLTYRFAMSAFWSGLAYAGVEVFSWGVIKGLVLRNLRWWREQPIFDQKGLLTIGYRYPNLKMAEFYNAPGSPAWSMKTLLVLALSDEHPFWTSQEEDLPELELISMQRNPFMLFMRNKDGRHIQALTSGQYARFEPSFMAAKYEKFAYSNVFGFSVPGGEYGLEQGAYDSMLALCEDDDQIFRVRRMCESVMVEPSAIISVWKPWKDVEIKTWLIPCGSWHVRVHRINSKRNLTGGEGAYAVNCDFYQKKPEKYDLVSETQFSKAFFTWGGTGIVNLEGTRLGKVVQAHPNTNIMYSRTVIPTLIGQIPIGITWLACAVLGVESKSEADVTWGMCPQFKRKEHLFQIYYDGACKEFTEE